MMKLILRLALIVFFLGLMAAAFAYRHYHNELAKPLNFSAESIVYEIPRGASFNKTLSDLKSLGVIDDLVIPKIYAKLNKIESQLKLGEVELNSGLTLPELMDILISTERVKYQVQLIEGWTFKQIRSALANAEKLEQKITDISDSDLLVKLNSEYTHPEGVFYPDTYFYHKGDTDLSILERSHKKLTRVLAEEWEQRSKALPLESSYEALILASIIEKETGVPSERSEIAGVFIRRLNKNMRLQTDPTVIYGLGDRYKGNIKRSHLREATPYNTYVIKGLPPTPIAAVGRAAIHAALNPKKGETLFFVARGDGSHQFSVTIDEHNAAVRKYQLKRRKDYRSSPAN